MEVGLFEILGDELKHLLILGHKVLLLEEGDLLPDAVQQLDAFSPFEVDKLLEGSVLLTILEVGELVAV